MPSPLEIQQAISEVDDQQSFIQRLLVETLRWPIPEVPDTIGDISFEWNADELKAEGLDKHLTDGRVYQIRKLDDDQPWGTFLLEFKNEDVFLKNRGLTGPLRRVLRGVVRKHRGGRSDLPAWDRDNLLFICTDRAYRHYRFAYFNAPKEKEKTAPLALFGWNHGDTDIRTLCTHNLHHLEWNSEGPDYSKWRLAFSVEKVTKDFYREYADEFAKLETLIRQSNNLDENDLRLFTQTLFNRVMFLRFIEKKGWLIFRNQTSYLSALYSAGGTGGKTFYTSRLCPLFFEALAIEGKQESDAIGKVPFLNGGLFDKSALDKKVSDIADEAFEPILGLDGLFYRYNFTVEESTPLDIEVAVDPEMLGKVFEELVTGRHESGSYYTPRPIVAFMCREALKAYLTEKTSGPAQAIAALVDEHQIAEAALTDRQAEEILFYLDTLKAVDPACGSGAYLLGLLQELIAIRRTLQNEKLRADPTFLYQLKLRIISSSLYGVDIDEFATNIAKLRLWLSLAVEAETPQPLPNLDFKIETGDSILGPCEKTLGPMFEKEATQLSRDITDLKQKHQDAHDANKSALFERVQEKINYLRGFITKKTDEKIIIWLADFAEVFTGCRRKRVIEEMVAGQHIKTTVVEPGGFDIVLANPPYIRQELIKDLKPRLKDVFKDTFSGTADLYTYFYTRAVELLAPGGVLSFISSNKWFRATYGKTLRKYIAEHCRIHSITDFGELPVFETAATFPMVFVAQKTTRTVNTVFTQVKTLNPPYPDVKAIIQQAGIVLPSNAIDGEDWNLSAADTLAMLRTMNAAGVPLKEYVNGQIYRGILTGFNEAFVIDAATRQRLIDEDPASADLIKPTAKGDHIRKCHIRNSALWLIVTPIGVPIKKYPAVFKHLKHWQTQLQTRADQGNHWWELRACTYYHIFNNSKIHYPEIASEPRFTLDNTGIYPLKTIFTIPSDDLYLLGTLNSKLAWDYLKKRCSVLGDEDNGGRLTLQTVFVEQLPIPRASDEHKQTIAALVQRCLDAKGENCEIWESQIDTLVARLYGLEA